MKFHISYYFIGSDVTMAVDLYKPMVEQFYKHLRFEKIYSGHTLISYRNDIDQFTSYLAIHLSITTLKDVTHHHVRSWIVHLMQDKYKAKTINRKLSTLKSLFKYLRKTGQVQRNPANKVTPPKIGRRLPEVVRESTIVNQLSKESDCLEDFRNIRDNIIIEILYGTGMRRSELINLKLCDIDFDRMVFKVLGKGKKERLIPLSKTLKILIDKYWEAVLSEFDLKPDHLIVTDKGQKVYPKFVYNKVNKWIANISSISKKSPHILRHSFATHMANNGAELNAIKSLLGHSSLASTEIYMHNSIERLKDVYKEAHPKARIP